MDTEYRSFGVYITVIGWIGALLRAPLTELGTFDVLSKIAITSS